MALSPKRCSTLSSTDKVLYEKKQEEFCRAVEAGDELEVHRLLKLGVMPDRVEKYLGDRRPLWYTSKEGHANVCRLLLESGNDVAIDAESPNYSENALAEAAIYGKEDVARVLLDYGASVNGPGWTLGGPGWTPLILASNFFGTPGLIWLLYERGAYIEARTDGEKGATSLHLASSGGRHYDIAVVLALLKAGADIDAIDNHGRTPERCALEHNFSEAVLALQNWRRDRTQ